MPGFSLTLLLLPRPGEAHAPSVGDILSLLEEGADPQLISTSSYHNAPKLHPLLLTMYRPDEEQVSLIIERLLKAGAVSSSADEGVQTISRSRAP